MTPLYVPEIDPDADLVSAAIAYAKAGWFVVPVSPEDPKNPGSVLGKGWQHQSSRDVEQVVGWFAGTPYLLALHVGRSGAWVADVDRTEKLHPVLANAITQLRPPHQSSRPDQPGRGHYLFLQPDGRTIGNSGGTLGRGWGEGRGRNGVIMVAPSTHKDAADGAVYRWVRTGQVPAMPAALAEALPDCAATDDAATETEVFEFYVQHQDGDRPELLDKVLRSFELDVRHGGSRHDSMVTACCWAMREAQAGLYPAATAATLLLERFTEVLAGEPGRYPKSEYNGILAWAVAQTRTDDPAVTRRVVEQRMPTVMALVVELLEQLQTWLDLPDDIPVKAALAVAVTAEDSEGEPAWLLLVSVPSSGKTEIVNLLGGTGVALAHLDDVTVAGLLSWSRGKPPKPTGILTRIRNGLVTFGDLSTLLATSDKGGRDVVFALLRRVYDGKVNRDVGAPSGATVNEPLSWAGRLNIVGAVTGAIDNYSVHSDQLGPRWLYVRLPDRDTKSKRAAATLARRPNLAEHRREARNKAAEIVRAGRTRLPQVQMTDQLAKVIEDAALVCCWGRATVPRHGYGTREIDGVATIEEPPRLVRQLTTVARGLLALGITGNETAGICRRLALDSMPATRRVVLQTLTLRTDNATTANVASSSGLHRAVARRTLEELEVIGVVRGVRDGQEPDDELPDRRACCWFLHGDDGDLIASVFALADSPNKIIH